MLRRKLRSRTLITARHLTGTLALLAIGILPGQQRPSDNPPETNFRISVNLVQIDATVTDSHAKPIRDLTKDDFRILLDGQEQPLTHFSHVQADSTAPAESTVTGAPKDVSSPSTTTRLKPAKSPAPWSSSSTTSIFLLKPFHSFAGGCSS
jgi:hypothetical protein